MLVTLRFERGGTLFAVLDEASAPETARLLRSCLPFRSLAKHSRWSGREVNLDLPEGVDPAPRENQTTHVSKGDVVYWREWEKGAGSGSGLIAFYYGAEHTRDHRGDQPVNVIGYLLADSVPLAGEIGERIWLKGAESVVVEAASDVNEGGGRLS